MTSSRDTLALQSHPASNEREERKGADLPALFHAVRSQLLANVDTMVAHAFATHAAQHNLPLPAVVAEILTPRSSEPTVQDAMATTGNPGLDFLNEQLQKNASSLAPQSGMPTPPWLRPFTLPENVRFTRTPDPVLRWERSAPTADELAAAAREAARMAAEEAERAAEETMARARAEALAESLPAWRRPFTLPPGVRYTRTPDMQLGRPSVGPNLLGTTTEHPVEHHRAETVSLTENPDGSVRSVTVTQTLTTVGSVTVSAPDMIDPMATALPLAAAPEALLAAPGIETMPVVAAVLEGGAPFDPLSLSASIAQRASSDLGLPGWFTVIRQGPEIPKGIADEQDNGVERDPSPVPMPVTFEGDDMLSDADSEGSAVFGRFFLDEDDHPTIAEPVAAQAAVASKPLDEPLVIGAVAPAFIESPVATRTERKAFGSHGIPGFENAMRFESHPDYYQHPPIELLALPAKQSGQALTREALEQNARLLEGVLEDFGVRGEIIAVRPGPVVTLYEFEPAPGVKSSRVINLSDDIARSMSAISARVAVVQGRNVIGIELPNERRETVFFRELVEADEFGASDHKLAIGLGKTIGGESVIVDLARMPHLLVAGTTGSGKSVAINTMILSLLYRMKPEECRLIMVDPKMLELSIYDGIPHLLTPVVTDSKKAVIALKWAVREMEDRYKKMAKVGVRNIDGFNARVSEAKLKGEIITRTVQTGFDRETGEGVFETEEMDLATIPYIVIIVDEMADLMMVAGKEIEGAIQRLAQMARAAGIHLIMATQRPSVDVITGTIKANFPTRISFQVTSKIDSRTILGEQGAEQLLGQGDMLHMAGGGRISRVHGPFVSDHEVEAVVAHLKAQGQPDYLDVTTEEPEGEVDDEGAAGSAPLAGGMDAEESGNLYDRAVAIVLRDRKCSTSYIQRRLSVGYNKAASLVERMEKEGLVAPANHAGKREILVGGGVDRGTFDVGDED